MDKIGKMGVARGIENKGLFVEWVNGCVEGTCPSGSGRLFLSKRIYDATDLLAAGNADLMPAGRSAGLFTGWIQAPGYGVAELFHR